MQGIILIFIILEACVAVRSGGDAGLRVPHSLGEKFPGSGMGTGTYGIPRAVGLDPTSVYVKVMFANVFHNPQLTCVCVDDVYILS